MTDCLAIKATASSINTTLSFISLFYLYPGANITFCFHQKKQWGNFSRATISRRLTRSPAQGSEQCIGDVGGGGAEAGVRILPEFEGHGYAKEAYAAACEYALYGIGMYEIRGKCYKENLRSKNMLTSVMRPAGEDDTYYYFRRTV